MKIDRPKSKQPMPPHAKRVFKGIVFDTYQWEQDMYDGTKKTFEKLKRPDTVVVFPVLPNGKIILIEEEQPGQEIAVGSIGGRVDEGEDVLAAAKRELLEESGYEAREFILLDAKHPTTKIDWVIYTFIAKGLKKVAEINPDGGEKINLLPVALGKFADIVTKERASFAGAELFMKFFEAKFDSKKMKELKELFKPIESK